LELQLGPGIWRHIFSGFQGHSTQQLNGDQKLYGGCIWKPFGGPAKAYETKTQNTEIFPNGTPKVTRLLVGSIFADKNIEEMVWII